jgi:hypothetical protein
MGWVKGPALGDLSTIRTLTLRSRQTLQDRDWRFGAFLARVSRNCRVSPTMARHGMLWGEGECHAGPTARQDLGESDFRGGLRDLPASGWADLILMGCWRS